MYAICLCNDFGGDDCVLTKENGDKRDVTMDICQIDAKVFVHSVYSMLCCCSKS